MNSVIIMSSFYVTIFLMLTVAPAKMCQAFDILENSANTPLKPVYFIPLYNMVLIGKRLRGNVIAPAAVLVSLVGSFILRELTFGKEASVAVLAIWIWFILSVAIYWIYNVITTFTVLRTLATEAASIFYLILISVAFPVGQLIAPSYAANVYRRNKDR